MSRSLLWPRLAVSKVYSSKIGTAIRLSEPSNSGGSGGSPRVCVIGAGAIGSLLAAHLARVVPVSVLTRRQEHARALSERGLTVSGLHEFTVPIVATTRPENLPSFDIGFLATKTTGLDEAVGALEGRFPRATMVTIQNGLGAEELTRAHGPWPIVSGTTLMGGRRLTDTLVEYELDSPTWLGPYEKSTYERVEEITKLIIHSGLEAEANRDVRPAQWTKLVFNAAVGTVSAITGVPHSRPFADEQSLGALIRNLIDEGRRVADAAGIELREDPWELNTRPLEDANFSHAPSIQLDIEAGIPTEGDFNIGAIVREADRLGVSAPLSAAMYRLLKAKESSFA